MRQPLQPPVRPALTAVNGDPVCTSITYTKSQRFLSFAIGTGSQPQEITRLGVSHARRPLCCGPKVQGVGK